MIPLYDLKGISSVDDFVETQYPGLIDSWSPVVRSLLIPSKAHVRLFKKTQHFQRLNIYPLIAERFPTIKPSL